LPGEDDENERVFDVFASFTDDEEKTFIDSCYSFGLFNLKDKYTTTEKIIDGGSWSLGIEYDDGSNKTSYGINAGPKNIFNKCTTVFYDLCGDGVVGIVPSNYYNTPNVSISFDLRYNNYNFSDNSLCSYAGWNKSESLNKD
jgi:hypothetical protein